MFNSKVFMTRDECIGAASAAFGGAFAWARRGYWQIKIETTPLRILVLSKDFVQKNIFEGEMEADAFKRMLQDIPSTNWSADQDDGSLLYMVR
ncbi:MAG: hypothetical protein JO269_13065 [Burkholderiaceae bacterium]|nr:hypothetical protein [Burkholderiaceae bacterium]